MASNGNFNTTPYSNRYLTFSWSTYERSIENNYTKIYWELKGAGSQTQWFKSGPFTLVIDSETVFNSSNRIKLDNGTLVASGFKTIYHDADGSRSFSASASAAIYATSVNCWGSDSWELDPIPREAKLTSFYTTRSGVITYDWFTDECNPCVEFYNPAGKSVTVKTCISWTGGDDIAYRDAQQTSLGNGYYKYTFNFTDAEREALCNSTTNNTTRDVTIYITTWIGNQVYYYTRVVNLEIINCKPVLNPTVIDHGTGSTKYTGNPETMIRGYNTLYASFNVTLKKGAGIKFQSVTCGNKKLNNDGWFEYVYDNVFVFTLTDTRDQTVTKTVTMPAIDYIPITCDISYDTELHENNTADIIVTLSGAYFKGSFGALNNTITLQYIYGKDTIEGQTWNTITPTFSDGTYTTSFVIENVEYKDKYVVQAWAGDKINPNVPAKEQCIVITPVFDWGENDFNFNVPVTIEKSNAVTARCYSASKSSMTFSHNQSYGLTKVPLDTVGIQCGREAFALKDGVIEVVDDISLIRAHAGIGIDDSRCYWCVTINDGYGRAPNTSLLLSPVESHIGYCTGAWTQILSVKKGDKIGISVGKSDAFSTVLGDAYLIVEVIA